MSLRNAAHVLIFCALAACSDDPAKRGDVTSTDSGPDGDSTTPPTTAIVDRTPALTHDCAVATPIVQLAGGANWRPEALVATGSGPWLLRAADDAMSLSPIGADGTLGAPQVVLDPDQYAARSADAAALGDAGIAVAWRHDDTNLGGGVIRYAVAGTDGELEVTPRDLSGTSSDFIGDVRVIAGTGGAAIVLYTMGDAEGDTTLWFRPIAADGTASAAVAVAETGRTYGSSGFDVMRASDGDFAVAYGIGEYDAAEVELVRLDASGAARGPAQRISRAGGQGWRSVMTAGGMLEVDGQLWVAWTESWFNGDFADSQGTTTIVIGVVDAAGAVAQHTLVAPVTHETNHDPRLFALGVAVGVTWSSGTIIYVCGGCIADYDLNLLLVDPVTLVPASQRAVQLHQNNGIVRPHLAVIGDEVRVVASLDFHALSFPAVGSYTCEAE